MSVAARVCGTVSVACLLGGLSACVVPVPYPIPPLGYTSSSRHNLTDVVPAFISEGKTTRTEVLLRLGEPDASFGDGTFVYVSAYRKGGAGTAVIWGVAPGAGGYGSANEQRTAYRRLTVVFDGQNMVSSARMELKSCWHESSYDDHWRTSTSPSCLPATAVPAADTPGAAK